MFVSDFKEDLNGIAGKPIFQKLRNHRIVLFKDIEHATKICDILHQQLKYTLDQLYSSWVGWYVQWLIMESHKNPDYRWGSVFADPVPLVVKDTGVKPFHVKDIFAEKLNGLYKRETMGKPNLSGSDAGALILRLALGGIFVAHGVAKLLPWGESLESFSKTVGSLGIPGPAYPAAVAIVAAEILGGLLVILGLLPRLGALALAIVMAGAIYFVHLPSGFFLKVMATPQDIAAWSEAVKGKESIPIPHGIEFNVALLAMSLQVLLGGAGKMVVAGKSKKGGGKG